MLGKKPGKVITRPNEKKKNEYKKPTGRFGKDTIENATKIAGGEKAGNSCSKAKSPGGCETNKT